MSKKIIRTRFAPSPTGYMHIGSLRSALYSYIFTKQHNGQYILRIEDTDQNRKVEGATEKLIETFNNIGLTYDEGPILKNGQIMEKGDFGPYFQSKRLDLYRQYIKELVDNKKAYYCFCSSDRLDQMRKEQQAQKQPPKYDRQCLDLSEKEIEKKLANNEKYVVRFRIPDNQKIKCDDLVRGEVIFKTSELDDFVILKSDGFPTYHLAHIVDDYLMKISHVLRGEEWLPSLPKHLLLWQAFGWEAPEYAHLPLLLNSDKSKLSKRQGDVGVEDYLNKGYLPEAILNFVALLGWNPGGGSEQEVFSLKELIDKFDLNKVNKSGAIFNLEKLDWMNGVYIRKMELDKLVEQSLPYLKDWFKTNNISFDPEKNLEKVRKIVKVEQERLKKLSDITANIDFYYNDILDCDPKKLIWKKSDQEECKKNLQLALELLKNIEEQDFIPENLEAKFRELMAKEGIGAGNILWPCRYALTGQDRSPSPFEVAWVLGKEKSLARIEGAIDAFLKK